MSDTMGLGLGMNGFFEDPITAAKNRDRAETQRLVDKILEQLFFLSEDWYQLCGEYNEEVDEIIEGFLGIVSVLEDEGLIDRGYPRSY